MDGRGAPPAGCAPAARASPSANGRRFVERDDAAAAPTWRGGGRRRGAEIAGGAAPGGGMARGRARKSDNRDRQPVRRPRRPPRRQDRGGRGGGADRRASSRSSWRTPSTRGRAPVEVTVDGGGATLIRVADGRSRHPRRRAPPPPSPATARPRSRTRRGSSRSAPWAFAARHLPPSAPSRASRSSPATRARPEAFSIRVEGGRTFPVEPAAAPSAPPFEVRDLFFATPARLKFLKTGKTETAAVGDTREAPRPRRNPSVALRR